MMEEGRKYNRRGLERTGDSRVSCVCTLTALYLAYKAVEKNKK